MTASSEDSQHPKITVVRTTDSAKLSTHVGVLLQIQDRLSSYLIEESGTDHSVDVDTEARNEARKTFEMLQIRLRGILDDEPRWSPVEQSVEEDMQATVRLGRRHAELQLINSQRPSIVYSAHVGRLNNGMWAAWYGAPQVQDAPIAAVGRTADEAMRQFDVAFTTPEPPADAAPAPKKSSKKK